MYNGSNSGGGPEKSISRYHIKEETFGIATSLFGVCSRERKPHKFSIMADEISSKISSTFHHHAKGKKLSLNYQLSAAIQQMGCGPADIHTLCGFLGLCGKSIAHHTKQAEHVMGKVQMERSEASEVDAVQEEIKLTEQEEKDGVQMHECTIEGHTHPPLPKLKGSYGS